MNADFLTRVNQLSSLICVVVLMAWVLGCTVEEAGVANTSEFPIAAVDIPTAVPAGEQPAEVAPTATPLSLNLIPPEHPQMQYVGRVAVSPGQAVFDWPAVSIAATFEGTSVALELDGGRNRFLISVDQASFVLEPAAGRQAYQIASSLPEGEHTLRVTKLTEALVGRATFYGLILDPGRGLLDPPARPVRRIEFIGDSITTGYGNEGATATCDFTPQTQNAVETYAAVVARRWEAEYVITAYSGLGAVRNYNEGGMTSPRPMGGYMLQTLATDAGTQWPFEAWTPDVVVVNLGTNDFSTQPHPTREIFVSGYVGLLSTLRQRYPQTQLVAVSGPLMRGPAADYIGAAVVQLQNQGDGRVQHVALPNGLVSDADMGCDWHPNVVGHVKMAEVLGPAIGGMMGWE